MESPRIAHCFRMEVGWISTWDSYFLVNVWDQGDPDNRSFFKDVCWFTKIYQDLSKIYLLFWGPHNIDFALAGSMIRVTTFLHRPFRRVQNE